MAEDADSLGIDLGSSLQVINALERSIGQFI
jgi:hypothetical protein